MKTLLVLACFACSLPLLAAPAPKEKDDQSRLQGEFVFTSWTHGGQKLAEESRDTAKWSVKDDKYTFEIDGQTEEGTIKIDAAKKPATIDLNITAGADKDKQQLGIYKIDGNNVTFCFARPGEKERPADFTSTPDNRHILVTLKRGKKDD
jgi:uncharacterized protein (TIGR03067 family)